MTKDLPHSINFSDGIKKKAERIAALLEYDEWWHAFAYAVDLALEDAEAHVKGDTAHVFCTPKIAEMIENNPKFIAALAAEGVVEWLTPFVLTKTAQEPMSDEAGR